MTNPHPLGWKGLPLQVLHERGVTTTKTGDVRVPYYLESGHLHNLKVFSPVAGGDWRQRYRVSGKAVVLYGLDRLASIEDAKEWALLIAEGESDTLALISVEEHFPACDIVGVPGARTWHSAWADIARRYRTVYVLADGDSAGEALARSIKKDVPDARMVAIPAGADVRDLVQRDEGVQELLRLIREADGLAALDTAIRAGRRLEEGRADNLLFRHEDRAERRPRDVAADAPASGVGMSAKHSEHLAALLDDTRSFIRSYVVLAPAQADANALWVAHTHALDAFETTPFLAVTSPEKRCGKTRLLDVLELVVAKPWRTIMPTDAVLFRKIDAVAPTLLLDETDAIFNARNGNTEPLRAVLNAGNRRGTCVPRCVGPKQELVDFNVFCAKALTGIGTLPDTVADRSIPIRLARKRQDEPADRFRRREALARSERILQSLASWGQDAVDDLASSRPRVPDALDDRAEEAWEPLLAIAGVAGGHWPERARTAAVQLSASSERDEEALGVLLLADVRDVFKTAAADRLSSANLAAALCDLEESPWGDLWGKPLDARELARRLKPYAVRPRTVRFDDGSTAKGYLLEQLADAFARYPRPVADTAEKASPTVAGVSGRHNVTTRMDTGFAPTSELSHDEAQQARKPASANGCDGVTDNTADEGTRHVPLPGDPGYALWVDRKFAEGHVAGDELRSVLRVDGFVATTRTRA